MKRLCALVLLAGLLLTGAACGGEPAPTATPTPASAVKQTPAKKWVKLAGLQGSASATSAPFRLKGGQQKLTYTIEGKDIPTVAFYVVEKGTDLLKEGGFPVAALDKPAKGSKTLSRPKGTYVVIVNASECTWSCTLSELR